jgi:hypothetical protein
MFLRFIPVALFKCIGRLASFPAERKSFVKNDIKFIWVRIQKRERQCILSVCLTAHVDSKSRNGEHGEHHKEHGHSEYCATEPALAGTWIPIQRAGFVPPQHPGRGATTTR